MSILVKPPTPEQTRCSDSRLKMHLRVMNINRHTYRIVTAGIRRCPSWSCLWAETEIWNWCSQHHSDILVPDEVVIFDMLLQAAAEAHVMIAETDE